jgi:hypothetical protein
MLFATLIDPRLSFLLQFELGAKLNLHELQRVVATMHSTLDADGDGIITTKEILSLMDADGDDQGKVPHPPPLFNAFAPRVVRDCWCIRYTSCNPSRSHGMC